MNETSNDSVCTYHPGVPIFHEGLKYWTCCTRRTSDFQAFLNQEGCETGIHDWKTEKVMDFLFLLSIIRLLIRFPFF